jgi:hypothetical protein
MMRIEHAVMAMGQIVPGVVGFTAIAVSVVFKIAALWSRLSAIT